MAEIKVLQVIEVTSNRGRGTEESPIRNVREYFDMQGNKLAEYDPSPDSR